MKQSQKNEKTRTFMGIKVDHLSWQAALYAFAAILIAPSLYLYWFHIWNDYPLSANPESWAQFGDYFGGTVGPIIGLASVILLVSTLQLQRTELREQREQLKESAKEAREQNRIMSLQSFEQSFFIWLKEYKMLVAQITFCSTARIFKQLPHIKGYSTDDLEGVAALKHVAKLLSANELYGPAYSSHDISASVRDVMRTTWDAIWRSPDDDSLRSAVRLLGTLVMWVNTHEALSQPERQNYIDIIKAQITDPELIVLYAYSLNDKTGILTDLIFRYEVLEHLDDTRYISMRYARPEKHEATTRQS